MAKIGRGYGSEWHLLRYLGRHRREFDTRVCGATGADQVEWLDYPFRSGGKRHDGEWQGLGFIPDGEPARSAWSEFWPGTGSPPNWDAVGQVVIAGQKEWLLVEAKANAEELLSSCSAKPTGGLNRIAGALDVTKQLLNLPQAGDWLSPYYQLANRIAVLAFLHQHGVRARLLLLYFTGDSFPDGRPCPESEAAWSNALAKQDRHLGLTVDHFLSTRIHQLFLPVV